MSPERAVSEHWGVQPVLFRAGNWQVPSYGAFILLGILTGLLVYLLEARRNRILSRSTLVILIAAVVGGILGAKGLYVVLNAGRILRLSDAWALILGGRSIVGGLAGGAIAVFLVKRKLGITERKGNLFAPAIAAGVAVGRLGCFLRGCCHGKPTSLPWGVDFGDGIPRHPTQIYESFFMLGLFIILMACRDKVRHPAVLFWILMLSYFLFRFFVEFIRVEEVWAAGLTSFQWISLAMVAIYAKYLVGVIRHRESAYAGG
jgi:phosphatidylglycerol---prolipoprotein diacylglyceryl transferase